MRSCLLGLTHLCTVAPHDSPLFKGAMPIGNGALTVLCWPNVSMGGVGLYVGHQNAMDSETALIRLGEVQVGAVSTQPGPCIVRAS
jgi:hypothetical protein